jgi:ABC-2 type transport system permease protein
MTGRVRRALVRVGAMAAKETLHIRRDPRTLYLALGMPVVLLLLFGYGVTFDLERMPLALVDQDHTPASRVLLRAFQAAGEFEGVSAGALPEAEALLRRGQALAALVVPAGYGDALGRGEDARVQLLVDGADPVSANQVLSKADALARNVSQVRAGGAPGTLAAPLTVKVWMRYNPAGRSALFLVPGLAAYLLAISAVLLTALTVAGEWERGSMEQLFASPVGRLEIVLGKLLPYWVLGLFQLLLVLAFGATAFDLPMRGPPLLLLVAGALFLVGMLGQGLLISVVAKNQLVATQAGALSAMLPSLLFSGMLFPLENMPLPLQVLSRVVPARYLVHAVRGVLLKGNGLAVLWPDLVALAAFAVAMLALATTRFHRRLA